MNVKSGSLNCQNMKEASLGGGGAVVTVPGPGEPPAPSSLPPFSSPTKPVQPKSKQNNTNPLA